MRFQRKKLEISPPFVSMADIAFNLVLFFLIMAKTQDDSHIQWDPAKTTGAKQVANAKVSVSIDKNSRVYLNGTEIATRDLAAGVARELAQSGAADRTVLLKIHRDTLASTFEPVLEAVGEAGSEVVHVLDEELN